MGTLRTNVVESPQGVPEGKPICHAVDTKPVSVQPANREGSVVSSITSKMFKSRELNLKQTKKIVEKIPPTNLWIYFGKVNCSATESLEEIIEGYAHNPQMYLQKTVEQAHIHIACREANMPKSPVGEWIQKDIGIKMSQINTWGRLSFEITSGKDSEFPIRLNDPKFKHLFETGEKSNIEEEKNARLSPEKSFPSSGVASLVTEPNVLQTVTETEASRTGASEDNVSSKSASRENSSEPSDVKTPMKKLPPTTRAPEASNRAQNTQNSPNVNYQLQQKVATLPQSKASKIDTPPLDDLLTKTSRIYSSEDKGTAQRTPKEYEEIIRDLLERNKFLAMRSQSFENDAIVAKNDFQTMVQRWTDEKGRILNATAQNQSRMFSEINLLTKQIDQLTEALEKEKLQTRMLTERIATTVSYKM